MVRIANHHFSDPYQYEYAVRAANVRGLATARGDFRAELLQVDLDRLWLQAGSESLPRSAHITVSPARFPILFLAGPDEPTLRTSGVDLKPGMIVVWAPGSGHFQRTQRTAQWATMSLTPDGMASAGIAIAGREIPVPDETGVVKPSPQAMSRLVGLHADLRQLARKRPHVLAHPEVARALENALTHAMVTCLSEAISIEPGFSYRQHVAVMKRLADLIVESAGRPLYLAEVCKSVGASERTLRRCCQEQIGMAPNRYLLLRRLHLSRQRLLRADHRTSSVTEIATSLGFWELGRFSGAYHAAFGELPRETLNRPPQEPSGHQMHPVWL